MKKKVLFSLFLLTFFFASAQENKSLNRNWRVTVERRDGKQIVFRLQGNTVGNHINFEIINASERIEIDNVNRKGDSIFFSMPAFESDFRVKLRANGDISGTYLKRTASVTQQWPLYGVAEKRDLFDPSAGDAKSNISGRWDVIITRPDGTLRKAVALFKQSGNRLTGSFLTPSSDYRYLDGIVTGDSLFLSSFDGDNARLLTAQISNPSHITGGIFYNGYTGKETWKAEKNNDVALPEIDNSTRMRQGQSKLAFTFSDLDGKPVSLSDKRFKDKVVILQLMGSWCANCLDETKFLSNYYNNDKPAGVEIIALAFELTTDMARSRKSLSKFQKMFNVNYPMLITGVTSGDTNKTEKTLPQLTPIRSFPTTVFIGKDRTVKDIHTNFYGPASGVYYDETKRKFYETVEKLLSE